MSSGACSSESCPERDLEERIFFPKPNVMRTVTAIALLPLAALAFSPSSPSSYHLAHHLHQQRRTASTRTTSSSSSVRMAAIPEGGKVLCVGTGPVLCLAAKKAALAGYDTSIIGGEAAESYRQLLSEPGAPEVPNLTILESITGAASDKFDELLGSVDAILLAIDGDAPIGDGLIDLILPAGKTKVQRIVAMSRNLNGKGMGPFVVSSKMMANQEVWSCNTKDDYVRFEAKLKSAAAAVGADCVIARAGTLKGGGPGGEDASCAETARTGLSYAFYNLGQQDIVNWRLLFDCNVQGVELTKGDTAEGPGFTAVFAATAAEAKPGDTGRHGVAGAMVHALGHGPGGVDFAVRTAEGSTPPSKAEWDALFAKL
jgi:hypothetical protein